MFKERLVELHESVSQYTSLTRQDWLVFSGIFSLCRYKKAQHIIDPGMEKSRLFFVCSGLIRYYYLADDGKEWNKAFICESSLAASFSADFLGQASPYGIQTLEDTVLLEAKYSDFEVLYANHPMIERLGRKFIEQVLIFKMNRERSLLENDAKVRYLDFFEQHSSLAKRIPQYHLASYLGVSEVSLSRIVRKINSY